LEQLAVDAFDIALDIHVLGNLIIEPVQAPPVEVNAGGQFRQFLVEPLFLAAADPRASRGHVHRYDQHPAGHTGSRLHSLTQ